MEDLNTKQMKIAQLNLDLKEMDKFGGQPLKQCELYDEGECDCLDEPTPLSNLDAEYQKQQEILKKVDIELQELDEQDLKDPEFKKPTEYVRPEDEIWVVQMELANNELKLAMIDREIAHLEKEAANDPPPKRKRLCGCAPKPKNRAIADLEAELAADEELIRLLDAELGNLNKSEKCCG